MKHTAMMHLCLLLCPLPTLFTCYTCRRLLEFLLPPCCYTCSTLIPVSLNYHYSYHHILPHPFDLAIVFLSLCLNALCCHEFGPMAALLPCMGWVFTGASENPVYLNC
ncbi:hypothetical protein M752DRAFT_107485 [Aspergillus phoenicis ATCC 13157]|uniref:C2H2-type domain-containing protein n=1 Tax=Aspergillus phoenicis ATCC 13157 TaxID=1353007 RepID=A0A370P575_ASPPH|nr:hypothetical protein M752DRAFT_107485 [Aspergillus phoenicis ATCC 13157]